MELYQAIVKMEQGGSADGILQVYGNYNESVEAHTHPRLRSICLVGCSTGSC